MENYLSFLWDSLNLLIAVVGSVMIVLTIVGAVLTLIAWSRKIIKPLWRLGLGLARKNITIVSNQTDGDSLSNLISSSEVFATKNVKKVCSREDMEDIRKADVILFKYSGSPFTLSEILKEKHGDAAIVIYAKQGEIQDRADWELMDLCRNISVCNLKGRLLNDLFTLMMTTKI